MRRMHHLFFLRCFEHRMTVPTLDLFGKLDPSLHLQPGTYKAPKPDGSEKLVAESGNLVYLFWYHWVKEKCTCVHLHPLASWLGAALSVQMQAWQGKHCNALQAQGEVPQGFSSAQALGQSLIRQNVSKSALRQKALAWLACGCTVKCTTHHHTILESYKYSICFFIVCTLEMIAHVFSIICKNLLLSLSLKTSAYSMTLKVPQTLGPCLCSLRCLRPVMQCSSAPEVFLPVPGCPVQVIKPSHRSVVEIELLLGTTAKPNTSLRKLRWSHFQIHPQMQAKLMMKVMEVWLGLCLQSGSLINNEGKKDSALQRWNKSRRTSTWNEKRSIHGHRIPQWCVCVAITANAIHTTSAGLQILRDTTARLPGPTTETVRSSFRSYQSASWGANTSEAVRSDCY